MPDRFSNDGVLFAFIAYFVSASPIRLQVWRPAGSQSSPNLYQLVCEQRVDVTGDQLSRRTVVCTQLNAVFVLEVGYTRAVINEDINKETLDPKTCK